MGGGRTGYGVHFLTGSCQLTLTEDWGSLQGSLQRALLWGHRTHSCSCSQSGPAPHMLGNAISSWLPLSPTHTFHGLDMDLCPLTNSHSIITG